MKGYGPETFGEHMADVYDSMFGTRLADATTADAVELLAELAAGGRALELRDRWSDWKRSAFTAASRSHVSLYALP